MELPGWGEGYLRVGSCSCSGCSAGGSGRSCLSEGGSTQFVHEVDGTAHVLGRGEAHVAAHPHQAGVGSGAVVLLADLHHLADVHEEVDGERQEQQADHHEAPDRLVVRHLLQLAVLEQQVYEFVLHFYRNLRLLVSLSVAHHCPIIIQLIGIIITLLCSLAIEQWTNMGRLLSWGRV